MLLTGAYFRSLDEKQRLAIPKKVRDAISTDEELTLVIAPGTDGSLALYPQATFHKLAQRIEQTPPNARDVRAFSRMFYARSQPVDVDPQGRLRVPAELAELAGLDKRVVLLGVRDHLELWDQDRWEAYLSTQDSDYDTLAENVFHHKSQGPGVGSQESGDLATSEFGPPTPGPQLQTTDPRPPTNPR